MRSTSLAESMSERSAIAVAESECHDWAKKRSDHHRSDHHRDAVALQTDGGDDGGEKHKQEKVPVDVHAAGDQIVQFFPRSPLLLSSLPPSVRQRSSFSSSGSLGITTSVGIITMFQFSIFPRADWRRSRSIWRSISPTKSLIRRRPSPSGGLT